jgi:hypothetical protein
MRFSALAMGPVLAGCALLAVTSCGTDEPQTEAGLAPTMSPAVTATSAYDIVKVPAMTIDGNLSEWANIAEISIADNSGRPGTGVDNTAKVKLAWDNTYLYAAYNVTDTELLAAQTARDHGDIYKDDAVELYIDPQGDGSTATSMTTTDYQFLANIRDALGDLRGNGTGGKDASFNASSFLAKAVTNGTLNATGADVGYTVELRIAWSDLGVTPSAGHFMRLDVAVDDDDTGNTTTEEFDWAGLTSNFNNPSGWKDVQLVNPPPPPSAYDIVKVPGMTIDGKLSDWRGVSAISMADDPGNGRGSLNNSAEVKLAWDDTYLYAAYDVTDTELLAVQTARDHGDIYKDDAVELYLDPQGDGTAATSMTATDYQFLANVRDALGDLRGNGTGGKDASFNASSFLAKAVTNGTVNAGGTDTDYAVELRVAWSDLGVTPAAGNFLRLDLAVDDDDTGNTTTEEFDWAGLTSNFNNPSGWKNVKLVTDVTPPAAPTSPAATAVSSSQIDVAWTASTSQDVAKYNIYRATSGTPTLYKTVTGSPYQDTGLSAGTTYTYQISAVDAAGNESPKTAAKSATTTGSGGGGTALRVGLMNTAATSDLGKGPGDDTSGPIYKVALGIPTTNMTSLTSYIANADAQDITLVLNLAGSRGSWTDPIGTYGGGKQCAKYNPAEYEQNVRRFEGNAALRDAINRRRAVIYVVDEPYHEVFCNSVPPSVTNQMGLLTKSIWPGAITIIRGPGDFLKAGWAGSGQLGPSFWSGLDYGWAQFGGDHGTSANETPAQYYADQKAQLASINLGMVPGHNLWNAGADDCWDYQNTGSSSGRIHGQASDVGTPGKFDSCATPTGSETRWVSSPAVLRASIDAAYSNPDAPFFAAWTHIYPNWNPQEPWKSIQHGSSYVAALDYWITKGATRTTWNGWRTAK